MKPRTPLGGPLAIGAVQLFPNSSACSWDPKFRQPVIECLVLALMDKSALCQDYAADPNSGWGPAAPGKPIGAEPSCIELDLDVLYSTPPGGQWHAALGTTDTTTEPPYLT